MKTIKIVGISLGALAATSAVAVPVGVVLSKNKDDGGKPANKEGGGNPGAQDNIIAETKYFKVTSDNAGVLHYSYKEDANISVEEFFDRVNAEDLQDMITSVNNIEGDSFTINSGQRQPIQISDGQNKDTLNQLSQQLAESAVVEYSKYELLGLLDNALYELNGEKIIRNFDLQGTHKRDLLDYNGRYNNS